MRPASEASRVARRGLPPAGEEPLGDFATIGSPLNLDLGTVIGYANDFLANYPVTISGGEGDAQRAEAECLKNLLNIGNECVFEFQEGNGWD